MIKVVSIKIDETFDFEIQKCIKQRNIERIKNHQNQEITMKTAIRRGQAFKRRENMHLLEDILFEHNYLIQIEKEDREGIRGNTLIFYQNTLLFDLDDIMYIGKNICDYVINKLGKNKQITLDKNELKKFFNE